jgi:hypothetical protein
MIQKLIRLPVTIMQQDRRGIDSIHVSIGWIITQRF